MIIVMEENATEEQIVRVVDRLIKLGFDIHRSTGSRYTLLGAVGARVADPRELELLEGVNKVAPISAPYKLAARAFKPEGAKIEIRQLGRKRISLFPSQLQFSGQIRNLFLFAGPIAFNRTGLSLQLENRGAQFLGSAIHIRHFQPVSVQYQILNLPTGASLISK